MEGKRGRVPGGGWGCVEVRVDVLGEDIGWWL